MTLMEIFINDHPELKKVDECEYADILVWARKNKYISLTEFEGTLFYTEENLETAIMWAEKKEIIRN
jgi:hypothetical protein